MSRFVVAKYAPDLRRMEPKNIGVIVWHEGKFGSKFLTAKRAKRIVKELDTYHRWVKYWQGKMQGTTIDDARGTSVKIGAPESVDALLSMQKGNYMLVDAGFFLDIADADLKDLVDYMFGEMVETQGIKRKEE